MCNRLARKAKRAFTLIEILIVVVILGILAAIIIPQFAESAESAQESAAKSTLQTVRTQFELCKFKSDCDCNPADVASLLATLETGEYLQSEPVLPGDYTWGLAAMASGCQKVIVDHPTVDTSGW